MAYRQDTFSLIGCRARSRWGHREILRFTCADGKEEGVRVITLQADKVVNCSNDKTTMSSSWGVVVACEEAFLDRRWLILI